MMFIGRKKELSILERKINSDVFEFGLLYGRRRVGKTELLKEIYKSFNAIYFAANEESLESNLQQLSRTVAVYFQETITFSSFENIFLYLVKKSNRQKIILIIDEFTYLLKSGPHISSILQNIIDQFLLDSSIKLIFSGNQVGILEDVISYKKPLYGRSTFQILLKPFDYQEAALFYPQASFEDKIRLYSIFGGLPFYLSKIKQHHSVKQNIINLVLENGAIFENEINFLLTQELRNVQKYYQILKVIANGTTQISNITSKAGISHTGSTIKYLEILQKLAIVDKEICFGSKNSKKTLYFIKDQFFNFSFRFIENNKSLKIVMNENDFYDSIIEKHLDEYVSFEFKKICQWFLVQKNSKYLEEYGKYWGSIKSSEQPKKNINLEIDIVLKTTKQLAIFECKWSNNKINLKNIQELQNKGNMLNKVLSEKIKYFGFFSRSGYEDDLPSTNLMFYQLKDLFTN